MAKIQERRRAGEAGGAGGVGGLEREGEVGGWVEKVGVVGGGGRIGKLEVRSITLGCGK